VNQHDLRRQAEAPAGPSESVGAVVEGVMGLMRAELRLAVAEAKGWTVQLARAFLLVWLLLLLLQLVVLFVAVVPLLTTNHGWISISIMLLLVLAPTTVVGVLLAREAKRFKELSNATHVQAKQRSRGN
jgi:uncharacterized membrane protein YqjE